MMMENINGTFSDCEILYTFSHYFLMAVLTRPATQDVINRCTTEYARRDLLVRRECVYGTKKGCGYVVLNFLESIIWLLKCEPVSLSDETFSEAVTYMDSAFKRARDLTDEEKKKLPRYYRWTTYAAASSSYSSLEEERHDRVEWIRENTDREGQFAWGPVYWAFLHRCVYRLEDKLIRGGDGEDGEEKARLRNCFTSLMWFVAFMDEFLPCSMCAFRYRYENSTRSKLYAVLEAHCDCGRGALEYGSRPLTKAFYQAHREHSASIGGNVDYTFENLSEDLKKCPIISIVN
jgi:hypothetical protein